MALTKRVYTDGETIITAQNLNDIQDEIISQGNTLVPKTRTVNGKALSSNITLKASDIPNDSDVSGTKIDDALETLLSAIGDVNKFTSTEAINFDTEERFFVYYDYTNSTGTKPPVSGNGYLLTFKRSNNYSVQFAWSASGDGGIFIRRKRSGTLGDWLSLSHGDLTPDEVSVTVATTLPTGVTAVGCLDVNRTGNVVTVSFAITRDTNGISSWANVATGLPIPKKVSLTGSAAVPMGECSVGDTYARPMQLYVNSSGTLRIKYGNVASGTQQYIGSFTYITDEI